MTIRFFLQYDFVLVINVYSLVDTRGECGPNPVRLILGSYYMTEISKRVYSSDGVEYNTLFS